MQAQTVTLRASDGEEHVQKLRGNGHVDWAAVKEAFEARLVEIVGEGTPSVFPANHPALPGFTLDTWAPGSVIEVAVKKLQQQQQQPGVHIGVEKDDDLSRFWKALKDASVTEDSNGKVLKLPEDVSLGAFRINLLVRSVYETFWELIDRLYNEGHPNVFVLGTPGIGKTCFSLYLLFKLAQLGAAVVVEFKANKCRILFDGTEAWVGGELAFRTQLNKPETWYLVDAMEPQKTKARTILTTSPARDVYKEFEKYPAVMLVMPGWDREEMNAALPLYPGLSPDLVEQLWTIWGGIPRYVLEGATSLADAQLAVRSAISRSPMGKLLSGIGEPGSMPEVSHRLVNLVPTPDYRNFVIQFHSEWIAGAVFQAYMDGAQGDLLTFLRISAESPQLAGVRGTFFEQYGHKMIRLGGDFEARDLGGTQSAPLEAIEMERRTLIQFSKLEEVRGQEGAFYCQPKGKTFAAIDALIQPNILLQFTVSSTHPVNASRLRDSVMALQERVGVVFLYFVVPPDKYDAFQQQVISGMDYVENRRVQQRVLKLRLGSS